MCISWCALSDFLLYRLFSLTHIIGEAILRVWIHVRCRWVPAANFTLEVLCILLWVTALLVLPQVWPVQKCFTTHHTTGVCHQCEHYCKLVGQSWNRTPFHKFRLYTCTCSSLLRCSWKNALYRVAYSHILHTRCLLSEWTFMCPEFILSLVSLAADVACVWVISCVGLQAHLQLLIGAAHILTWLKVTFSCVSAYT
jgi:hypothetical protein